MKNTLTYRILIERLDAYRLMARIHQFFEKLSSNSPPASVGVSYGLLVMARRSST